MRKKRRSAGPIYVFAGVWLLSQIASSSTGLGSLLISAGISLLAAVGVGYLFDRKRKKQDEKEAEEAAAAAAEEERRAAEKAKEESSPYSPEVQAIIREGRVALKEMGRLYSSIPDPNIRSKINELMSVSDKIVRDAIDDPSDVPQIRKFLDYYLPTTIKLLNAYDRMNSQEISGSNEADNDDPEANEGFGIDLDFGCSTHELIISSLVSMSVVDRSNVLCYNIMIYYQYKK